MRCSMCAGDKIPAVRDAQLLMLLICKIFVCSSRFPKVSIESSSVFPINVNQETVSLLGTRALKAALTNKMIFLQAAVKFTL